MKAIVKSVESRFSPFSNGELEINMVVFGNPNPREIMEADFDELFPSKAVVECGHCGQWGARKCACKHCGAPVN
jgi:hypothetical protein